jgi:GDP-L-fucose synthase
LFAQRIVDDLADACVFIMQLNQASYQAQPMLSHLNVGTAKEITIRELAKTIKQVTEFKGNYGLIAVSQMGLRASYWMYQS